MKEKKLKRVKTRKVPCHCGMVTVVETTIKPIRVLTVVARSAQRQRE